MYIQNLVNSRTGGEHPANVKLLILNGLPQYRAS